MMPNPANNADLSLLVEVEVDSDAAIGVKD